GRDLVIGPRRGAQHAAVQSAVECIGLAIDPLERISRIPLRGGRGGASSQTRKTDEGDKDSRESTHGSRHPRKRAAIVPTNGITPSLPAVRCHVCCVTETSPHAAR